MGGDLGGTGGTVPPNLRWGTAHASSPLIYWEVVFVGCARKHEQSKKSCHQGIIFWNRSFSGEEKSHTTLHAAKIWEIWKDRKKSEKHGQSLKKVIRNFFIKVIQKSWSANFFPSPQTRRQVSAYDTNCQRTKTRIPSPSPGICGPVSKARGSALFFCCECYEAFDLSAWSIIKPVVMSKETRKSVELIAE